MSFKRLILLLLVLLELVACSASDHHSDTDNNDTAYTTVNNFAVPSTYAELAEYVLFVADLQSAYQAMMDEQEHTFESSVKCFADLYAEGLRVNSVLSYLQISVPDADMRALASDVKQQLTTWFFQIVTDASLHEVMQSFVNKKEEYAASEQEVITSVEEILTLYGMNMNDEDRRDLNLLNIQTEMLEQQINYLDLEGDPDVLIPSLFSALINVQTASANLIGYENYAEFKISSQMPGSVENVESFLLEALNNLHIPFDSLIDKLQLIKADMTEDPQAVIYYEDKGVYLRELITSEYGIADFETKYSDDGFFPLDDIIATLFALYDNYFGIELIKSDPPGTVWHEDVEYFEIRRKETGLVLGSVYLDLLARDGKQDSSKIATLINGYTDENGTDVRPVFVWHMCLADSLKGEPVMVSISKTLSMFHEFGHLLQRSLSSASVSPEFVEIYSQLFEEYFYEREVFASLLGTSVSLTDAEYDSWISSIAVYELAGKVWSFSCYLNNLKLYTEFSGEDDIDVLALQDEILNNYYLPRYYNSTRVINVGNQVSYPASLYSYGWSLGIALDVADEVRSNGGLLNKTNAEALRDEFYSLKDPLDKDEVVRSFLGRDWNMEAFYDYYGVKE